jgi:hypothetical protein
MNAFTTTAIRTLLALVVLCCSLALTGCSLITGDSKIDEGIVIAPGDKIEIRASTALVASVLAEVKRGDRLDILEQRQVRTPTLIEEWYKGTKDDVEGWIRASYVVNKSVIDKIDELYEKSQSIPSQGEGHTKVKTPLRIEPGGDRITYLSKRTPIEIVGKARTQFKPEKQEGEESEETEEPETRTVLWYQVRLPESEVIRAGWVGAQQIQLDVPEEILHLEGDGRRFTGWVVFDQTQVPGSEPKNNYIATMKSYETDAPIDFTRLWVLHYSLRYKRYIGAPINRSTTEDGLRGVLPILLTNEGGRKGFTIQELDENGKPVPAEYVINRASASEVSVQRITPKRQIKKPPARPASSR